MRGATATGAELAAACRRARARAAARRLGIEGSAREHQLQARTEEPTLERPATRGRVKTLLRAKHRETEPTLQAPWLPSQRGKPLLTRTAAAARGRRAFGLRRRLPPSGDGEHLSAATCCLTFELRRERRYGAWPARRMIRTTGSRAKCHAGASRLQRRVRRHCSRELHVG